MVRLTSCFVLLLFCPSLIVAAERALQPHEHKMVWNFAYAICEYSKKHQSMPTTLNDIKEYTDLRIDSDIANGALFTERYAIVNENVLIPEIGRLVIISVDTLLSGSPPGNKGRLIGYFDKNNVVGSMFVSDSMILPLLPKNNVLRPIGGVIPPPSWAKPQTTAPLQSDYGKRVADAFARGEIPVSMRTDKETWRDAKLPSPSPTKSISAIAQPAAKSANAIWWIIGLSGGLAVVVLVAFKKKPKE